MYTKRMGKGSKVLKKAAKGTTMYKAAKAMCTQDVDRNGVSQIHLQIVVNIKH